MTAPAGWEFEEVPGGPSSAPNPWFTRSERFIYDGVRRIQEIVTDPILADGEGNRVATMSFENETRNSGGGGGQASVLPTMSVFLRAQYVWGPGDGPANGVDELLCQIDPYASGGVGGVGGVQGRPWFILTDAQGDVVSIVGVAQDLSGNQVASVAGQWTYSPYGEVLTYDELGSGGGAHPAVVFGHKTLAIDRLDGPTLTWQDESEPGGEDWSFFETRRLEPGARLASYARNRTLMGGRFLQKDPNAAGTTTLAGMMHHGEAPSAFDVTVNVQQRSGDGINLYNYLGNNPIMRSDPTGLFFGPDIGDIVNVGLKAIGRAAESMVNQYDANLDDDMFWASDWSQGDNWHSRMDNSWVAESYTAGLYAGLYEGLMDALGPIHDLGLDDSDGGDPTMAGVVRSTTRATLKMARKYRHMALATADIMVKSKSTIGLTKAGHALVKHPELAGVAASGGKAFKALLDYFGSVRAINDAAKQQVKIFSTQGVFLRTGANVEFRMGSKAMRLRAADGHFDTFLSR